MVDITADFGGSIPEYYDSILGPAQFEALAADLVRRLPVRPRGDVLELACGTGLITQRLRERIDGNFRIVATDVNEAMLAHARNKVKGKIDWRLADAQALPFKDETFGLVVCGLGVMFVADKAKFYSEARRVLYEGGSLLFNVWDRLEVNPHAQAAAHVMETLFPGDAEMQFARVPYGYSDEATIRAHLDAARFGDVRVERVTLEVKALSARALATGQVRGTPRGTLIEKRGAKLEDVIERIGDELAQIGGAEPFRCEAHAIVVQAKAL
ncbi:MAG: class I SAM-dependent methyltransferase [Burkholderiales bacterium]